MNVSERQPERDLLGRLPVASIADAVKNQADSTNGSVPASASTAVRNWLEKRLRRAMLAGALPKSTDIAELALFVETLHLGLSAFASEGATVSEMRRVVQLALRGLE